MLNTIVNKSFIIFYFGVFNAKFILDLKLEIMTEQVVDIRDRIEKMRNQMSDDKVSPNDGALSKKSNIQEFSPLQNHQV